MRVKSGPSTAQKLAMFRESLSQHYKAQRSESPLARKTPKPSMVEFTGYAFSMATVIAAQEIEKHNQAVQEIERQKQQMREMNK